MIINTPIKRNSLSIIVSKDVVYFMQQVPLKILYFSYSVLFCKYKQYKEMVTNYMQFISYFKYMP